MPEYEAALDVLTGIWAEALRRDRGGISPQDSFFKFGGDSLTALWMVDRVAARGLVFAPHQVFEIPVLADLASLGAPERAERLVQEMLAALDALGER